MFAEKYHSTRLEDNEEVEAGNMKTKTKSTELTIHILQSASTWQEVTFGESFPTGYSIVYSIGFTPMASLWRRSINTPSVYGFWQPGVWKHVIKWVVQIWDITVPALNKIIQHLYLFLHPTSNHVTFTVLWQEGVESSQVADSTPLTPAASCKDMMKREPL